MSFTTVVVIVVVAAVVIVAHSNQISLHLHKFLDNYHWKSIILKILKNVFLNRNNGNHIGKFKPVVLGNYLTADISKSSSEGTLSMVSMLWCTFTAVFENKQTFPKVLVLRIVLFWKLSLNTFKAEQVYSNSCKIIFSIVLSVYKTNSTCCFALEFLIPLLENCTSLLVASLHYNNDNHSVTTLYHFQCVGKIIVIWKHIGFGPLRPWGRI